MKNLNIFLKKMLPMLAALVVCVAGVMPLQAQQVIINGATYPSQPPTGMQSIHDILWDKYDHPGYDARAYTEDTSLVKNGYATPEHVVLRGSTLAFYGYDIPNYLDYVYADYYTPSRVSYTMTPRHMTFHTFAETGLLFNGKMNFDMYGKSRYTGYALTLRSQGQAGWHDDWAMATLAVYYINNEEWDPNNYQHNIPARTLISTIRTDINNFSTDPIDFNIEIDPLTRAFKIFIDGTLKVDIPASSIIGGANGMTGFGFFTGYYDHSCPRLTDIYYEYVTLEVTPLPPTQTPTKATVYFMESGTTNQIRPPETKSGDVLQEYKIVQPTLITTGVVTYHLTSNSRNTPTNQDIELIYRADTNANITTLYYEVIDIAEMPPEKIARVNDGVWEKGTQAEPITASAGSEIEYQITAFAPPPTGVAMIRQGSINDSTSTSWWDSGSNPVAKRAIKTVTFIDFNDVPDYVYQIFVAETWNGVPMAYSAWDATDGNKPDKVWAWLMDAGGGMYDLYAGGKGGVWLRSGNNYQFYNFVNLQSIDFTNCHTDSTTSMREMFYNCRSLQSLDLSSFNTENVTDMFGMFYECSALKSLNLSSFNTENVTNMSYMFRGCTALQSLNLSNFKTDNVTIMSYMFYNCSGLTNIYFENADFAKVASFTNMFYGTPNTSSKFLTVHVYDATDSTWIRGRLLSSNQKININPSGATDYKPAPTSIPPTGYVKVIDSIPAGLNIDITSITGTLDATPHPSAITYTQDGQWITWLVPITMLPTTLSVKTTVPYGLPAGTVFNNVATVIGKNNLKSDTTFHKYSQDYYVREQYYLHNGSPTTTKIAPDLVSNLPMDSTYTVNGNPPQAIAYIFVGYDLGKGFVSANDPSGANAINPISSDTTIKFYYKQISVTIQYVREGTTQVVRTDNYVMAPYQNYFMPQSCFDTFTVGGTLYTYYDYEKNGDGSVKNILAATPPVIGAQPVFPDMSVPTFAYNTAPSGYPSNVYPMDTNMNITLYVTPKQAVTVNFVELNNPFNILHQPEHYFVTLPFDPATLKRTDGGALVALNASIDLRAEMELFYAYANTYAINGGPEQQGFPSVQNANNEITLFFEAYELVPCPIIRKETVQISVRKK